MINNIKTIWEMKAKGIILGIIVIALFSSCEGFELDGLFEDFGVSFNTDYYEVAFEIPPTPGGIEINLESPMHFDLEQLMADNGYENATVSSIQVIEAIIVVDEESKLEYLNPIGSVNTAVSTQGLADLIIASCVNDKQDATSIDMETPGDNVIDYLEDGDYVLKTKGSLKEDVTDVLKITAKMRYKVSLKVNSVQ